MISVSGNNKMPQSPLLFPHIPLAQKLPRKPILHLPIHIMHEHMRLLRSSAAAAAVPCHHPRRVDGRHPPRRLLIVPGRRVHHDQVPLHVVHQARQALERQLAHRVPRVADGGALRPPPHLDQTVRLAQLAIVRHVVRLQHGEAAADPVDPRRVLIEEHGAAAVVERVPHEAVVAEAEDEEVARRQPLEDSRSHRDLPQRLLRRGGGGGVVDQRPSHGRRDFPRGAAFRSRGFRIPFPRRRRRRRR